jgi:predicted MFS family arabinose efflux permease
VLFVAAVSLPFTVDAVSFLVSGLIVLGLRSRVQRAPRTEAPPPLGAALAEGIRFLWGSIVLRTLCLLLAVFNGVSAAVLGTLVLFATETLGLSERGYGVLLVVFAVGGLIGMVSVSRVRALLGTSGVVVLVLAVQAAAMLATAGDLVFWGDLDGKLHAFDAVSGKTLWETALQGTIQNSTITYAVNGKQYLAVLTGEGALTGGLIDQAGISPIRRHDAMHVFALP